MIHTILTHIYADINQVVSSIRNNSNNNTNNNSNYNINHHHKPQQQQLLPLRKRSKLKPVCDCGGKFFSHFVGGAKLADTQSTSRTKLPRLTS